MGLCHGHSSGIVAEDVCSTIVEGAGYDGAVAWELRIGIRIFGGIDVRV
jgi:hypothetical protein